jgi:BirA family biotin operon repressor/biotin-[acetyl-CoA-carboxylase] ligase
VDPVLEERGGVSSALRSAVGQLIDEGVVASASCTAQTASTNSDALAELARPLPLRLPRLHVTELQTAGRGRQGNRWQSDSDSLTFSLVLPFDPGGPSGGVLSLATGVAVAEALEFVVAPRRIALKWPNDICVGGLESDLAEPRLGKLGGILIETTASSGNHAVIGIGLNINRRPESGACGTLAAALAELLGRPIERTEVLLAVVGSVIESLAGMHDDLPGVVKRYRSRCLLQGRQLSLRQADRLLSGHCVGVADDGSLELIVDGVKRRVRSGEVQQIRPRLPG